MAHGTKFTDEELERIATEHETSSEEDESADWDYEDGRGATGSATITVRMPVAMIAALKTQAEAEGIGATVLARRLIAEGLADGLGSAYVAVADILNLAAKTER
jgi:hypothetical protein